MTDELDRQYSIDVFNALAERQILVRSLWIYEIANVLLVAHRRSRISQQQIHHILETVTYFDLKIDEVVPESALRLNKLAMQYQLTPRCPSNE